MDFFTHLKTYLNDEQIEKLKGSLLLENKHALLVNTNKITVEYLLNIYPNLKPHPIVKNAFIYDKNEYDLGKSLLHELGAFYLQEPSAMLPSFYLNPTENDFVLDMCAAPGGKSIQASLLMKNKGHIVANDIANDRQKATIANIERLGIGNIDVINNDLLNPPFIKPTFSKIILDAPCSGSGMFRKSDEMKSDWTYQKVLSCADIQKKLILLAYDLLLPGGELMYSTCSLSYEEDEDIIKYLLLNRDIEIVDISNPLLFKSKDGIGCHALPFMFPGEGHYFCKIKKPGQLIHKNYNDKEKEVIYGDTSFLIKESLKLRDVTYMRQGVKYATFKGNYKSFEYHYSRVIRDFPNKIELSLNNTLSYIAGNELHIETKLKGETLLTYNNLNICIAKVSSDTIKNRYPKGLRKIIK